MYIVQQTLLKSPYTICILVKDDVKHHMNYICLWCFYFITINQIKHECLSSGNVWMNRNIIHYFLVKNTIT